MDKEQTYNNPLVYQRADPFCYKHIDGYYYFTGSEPGYSYIAIRRAKALNELAAANERIVWRKHDTGIMGAHIWAPELHYIDGVWYIYFAAADSKDIWNIHAYALTCRDDDPMTGKWVEAGEIDVGAGEKSFTLDMTSFEYRGERYNIWAQVKDSELGSCLYIAKMSDPIHLYAEPMLLSRPEYEWEQRRFKVNEGPAVLKHGDKLFVTYSASDTGSNYCMGMLYMNIGSDPMDINSWTKLRQPVLKTDAKKLRFGPGHNSFTTDNGRDILIYHSRSYKAIEGDPLDDPNRHARAMVIEYDDDGFPIFED